MVAKQESRVTMMKKADLAFFVVVVVVVGARVFPYCCSL